LYGLLTMVFGCKVLLRGRGFQKKLSTFSNEYM
jgi:hypothetical protein